MDAAFVERHVGALQNARCIAGSLAMAHEQDRHAASLAGCDRADNTISSRDSGNHPHSTPLHQAVVGGHEAVVRLLVERGARLDLRDTVWQGTPLGWARYGGGKKQAGMGGGLRALGAGGEPSQTPPERQEWDGERCR